MVCMMDSLKKIYETGTGVKAEMGLEIELEMGLETRRKKSLNCCLTAGAQADS